MTIRTRAFIVFQLDKGSRLPGGLLPVQFNPTELSESTTAVYTKQTTSEESGKNYVQTNRDDFTVKLFYDASEASNPILRNVMKQVKPLQLLVRPTILFPDIKVPPTCTFIWGTFFYRGQITRIQENYSYFTQEGFPMRADVTVTFSSCKSQQEAKETNPSSNSRVLRTVRESDRLDLIAFDVYGDSTKWPLIAEANDIVDPVGFPRAEDLGTQIAIPEL
ncbi:MAG: phage tail protein [bacterium]|nr:phage tail protein [bacterium]